MSNAANKKKASPLVQPLTDNTVSDSLHLDGGDDGTYLSGEGNQLLGKRAKRSQELNVAADAIESKLRQSQAACLEGADDLLLDEDDDDDSLSGSGDDVHKRERR